MNNVTLFITYPILQPSIGNFVNFCESNMKIAKRFFSTVRTVTAIELLLKGQYTASNKMTYHFIHMTYHVLLLHSKLLNMFEQ